MLNQYYATTSFNNLPVYYYTRDASNPNLKPEESKQTEFGLNMKFLKNRIGIDVAWFKNDSYNQILALPYSNATGTSTQVKNVGNLRTKGWEISLDITPIKTENFKWDINANWSNPYTNVTSLADGVENITMGNYQGGVTINASLQDQVWNY